MKMGEQLLLGNKRRMDPRVWIKKKKTKESTAGNESAVGFIGCSRKSHD
jgi:hypothetical protein